MTRALGSRYAAYRTSIPTTRLTDSAIRERITGFPLPQAERANNGWWRVGTIVDEIEDKDFDVWYQPGPPRRLAVSERVRPALKESPPPEFVPDGIRALYRSNWATRGDGSGS